MIDFSYDVFLSHNAKDKPRARRLDEPPKSILEAKPSEAGWFLEKGSRLAS